MAAAVVVVVVVVMLLLLLLLLLCRRRPRCSVGAVLSLLSRPIFAKLENALAPMPPCPTIHIAFYLWYGTPALDGSWSHWDHATLPHWSEAVRERFPPAGVKFTPPEAPHSPYYPYRGLYSSRDTGVLAAQMSELAAAGVDSIMLSWWGQAGRDIQRDSQGVSTDELVPAVLDAAAAAGIGVSWHLEPYGGRSRDSVRDDLEYLHRTYGSHRALWRQQREDGGRALPVVWLYDVSAEHSGPSDADRAEATKRWRRVSDSVRGTEHDAILMSLYIDPRDDDFVASAGFDGAYSYFASKGFTPGSSPPMWSQAAGSLAKHGKWFAPSVGPGYNDSLIRPWNAEQTQERDRGAYYDVMWNAALAASPRMLTITSYNEWGEGTQIEAARPHTAAGPGGREYADYGVDDPGYYVSRTRTWIERARAGGCEKVVGSGAAGRGRAREKSAGEREEL